MKIDPHACHDWLVKKTIPKLAFDEARPFDEWKQLLREKFLQLVGMENVRANACPLNFEIEREERKKGYRQIRFTIESEIGSVVPVYVLIPDSGKEKYPVAIVLQGHDGGFNHSIGEPKNDAEKEYALGRGQFALQAVRRGYVAIAIEQRSFGERRPTKNDRGEGQMCSYEAFSALALGRTVAAERMWDVSKVIDALSNFSECDLDRICITGQSGGGTMAFYAACFDERIKLSVPSCALCSYKTSILDIFHCACNYIPQMLTWFEMGDLAALIAPRKLVSVVGREDRIFPITGAREAFSTAKKIFEKAGVAENASLVETNKSHYWCEDVVWNEMDRRMQHV